MKNLFLPLLITLFLVSGCLDESAPPEQNFAVGIIQAEFIEITEAESPQPIANTEMDLFVNIEGETEDIFAAPVMTDENGFIETDLQGGDEFTITNVIFVFNLNGEVKTVEEQVSLQLSFDEPYEEVSLVIEVETDSDDNGEND